MPTAVAQLVEANLPALHDKLALREAQVKSAELALLHRKALLVAEHAAFTERLESAPATLASDPLPEAPEPAAGEEAPPPVGQPGVWAQPRPPVPAPTYSRTSSYTVPLDPE